MNKKRKLRKKKKTKNEKQGEEEGAKRVYEKYNNDYFIGRDKTYRSREHFYATVSVCVCYEWITTQRWK